MVLNFLLLDVIDVTASTMRRSPQHLRQADFMVDLLHTLKVGLGGAFGSEDNILCANGCQYCTSMRSPGGGVGCKKDVPSPLGLVALFPERRTK